MIPVIYTHLSTISSKHADQRSFHRQNGCTWYLKNRYVNVNASIAIPMCGSTVDMCIVIASNKFKFSFD